MAGIAPDDRGASDRVRRLRRALVAVHLGDAAAVTATILVAVARRSAPTGPAYAALARAVSASLLPAAVAVVRERAAHGAVPHDHRIRPTLLLLSAGAVVNTIGTIGALRRHPAPRPAHSVGLGLLAGGDLITVPYVVLVAALHRRRRSTAERSPADSSGNADISDVSRPGDGLFARRPLDRHPSDRSSAMTSGTGAVVPPTSATDASGVPLPRDRSGR